MGRAAPSHEAARGRRPSLDEATANSPGHGAAQAEESERRDSRRSELFPATGLREARAPRRAEPAYRGISEALLAPVGSPACGLRPSPGCPLVAWLGSGR